MMISCVTQIENEITLYNIEENSSNEVEFRVM